MKITFSYARTQLHTYLSTTIQIYVLCICVKSINGNISCSIKVIQALNKNISINLCEYICPFLSVKVRTCHDFVLFSVHIQACRALMIIALIFGLVSIIVSTMGMKCINIGSRSDQSKGKIALSGGVLFILAGKHNMN